MLGSAPLGGAPLAGSASSGPATYTLAADRGVFNVVGDGNTFGESYVFSGLQPGVFALAGLDERLFVPTYFLRAAAGAFQLSGSGSFSRTYGLQALTGTIGFALTATVEVNRQVKVDAGAFVLTAADARFLKGFSISVGPGSFRLDGSLQAHATRVLPATARVVTVAGAKATLRYKRALALQAGQVAVTPAPANFSLGFVMQAQLGAFKLGTPALTLRTTRVLPEQPATYTLTGQDVTPRAYRKLPERQGVISITGTGVLARSRVAAVPALALTVRGADATPAVTRRLRLTAGSFAVAGQASASRALQLVPSPGGFAVSGGPAQLRAGYPPLQGTPATFAVSVAQAWLLRPARTLVATPGSFGLGGPATALSYSGSLAGLQPGPRWIILSTITVKGEESVQDFVATAPLQVTAIPTPEEQVVSGSHVQVYPINGELVLTVNHGLDYIPRVTITGDDGFEYEGDVNHTSGVVTVALGEHLTGKLTIGG